MARLKREQGFTILEAVVAMTMAAGVALASARLYNQTQWAFSSSEADAMLRTQAQTALNHVLHRVVASERLFDNTATGLAYLQKISDFDGHAPLTGSRLPTIEATGIMSAAGGSDYHASSVGNGFLMAVVVTPQDIQGHRIDLYRFCYFYLAAEAGRTIAGKPKRALWEWQSVLYADASDLQDVPPAQQAAVVKALLGLSEPVAHAWTPAGDAAAFWTLNTDGTLSAETAGTSLPRKSMAELTKVVGAVSGGAYRVGVAPNLSSGKFLVPRFAAANGDFPSGFEVVAVGPPSARQVFFRLVLAAEGSFSGTKSREEVVFVTVHDL